MPTISHTEVEMQAEGCSRDGFNLEIKEAACQTKGFLQVVWMRELDEVICRNATLNVNGLTPNLFSL